jgi:Polysaccharide deacetylase
MMRRRVAGSASGRGVWSSLAVGLAVLVFAATAATAPLARAALAGTEFQIQVDHTAHTTFALGYPGTYRFQIPSGASGLSAQYRHATTDGWATLPTKTSADTFNGVPAARFDYAAGLAYLSVPFVATTDSVYVRIVDAQGGAVSVSYLDMPRYYDNRRAAVVITLDDMTSGYLSYFQSAVPLLVNKGLFHTLAVETGFMDAASWATMRDWLNQGYTEAGSHTRTHPCTDRDYQNGGGYTAQISGSRDDLIANLGISYVPAFVQPCGFESTSVRQAVVAARYLADRSADTGLTGFPAWSSDGAYAQIGTTNNTDSWSGTGSAALRDQWNAQFNSTYSSGGIYHLISTFALQAT